MKKFFLILVISYSLFSGVNLLATSEDNYWIEATANTRVVKVGEPFRLNLTAGARNGWVYLPGKGAVLKGCHMLNYEEKDVSKRHEGFLARQGIYNLAAFSAESEIIFSLPVHFRWAEGNSLTAKSLPLRIEIKHLKIPSGLALINPRPPHAAKNRYIIFIIVFLLLFSWLSIKIMQILKARHLQKNAPPHMRAFQRLDRLQQIQNHKKISGSEIYVHLSRILRQYLADKYEFPAKEISRLGIIRELEKKDIQEEVLKKVTDFLAQADLVKFAKAMVKKTQIEKSQKQVHEIIQITSIKLEEKMEEKK